MAYKKLTKKKKPWETPELIAARSESVRMHSVLKYPAVKIARILGKNPNQIARWLTAAGVYKPLTPKQAAKMKTHSAASAHRLIRMEYKRETIALKAIDRLSEMCLCKECGLIFKPTLGFQEFCSPACRTKSYLKLNREIIAEKAKKKSDLFYRTRAESLYAAKKPKCNFCQNPISFPRFFKMNSVKFCSQKCSQKAESEKRKNDPIKVEAYKTTKKKTYLKRQLNGKNRREKREYYQNNIQAKIAKNLRARLYLAVKKNGGKKYFSAMNLVGADWPTLSAWIQSKFQLGMTWANYGQWHIDHEIPCASFDLTKLEQQRVCFHYTNLQPLWGVENLKKGAKIIPKK